MQREIQKYSNYYQSINKDKKISQLNNPFKKIQKIRNQREKRFLGDRLNIFNYY